MDDNEMKNTAEREMADKYGESFTTIETEKIDDESFRAWLRPEGIPSAVTRIAVNNDGTGLLDDYTTVRICHETSEKTEWCLGDYRGDLYVHTDNSQEYAWAEDPGITAVEYLKENKGDRFIISVILNEKTADLPALSGELVKVPGTLGFDRGFLDVYVLDEEDFIEIQSEIGRYDNMSSSEVKYMLDDAGGPVISMDLSKTYTSAEEIMGGIEK